MILYAQKKMWASPLYYFHDFKQYKNMPQHILKKRSRNKVIDANKFLLNCHRIMGVFPVCEDEFGDLKLQWKSIITFYTAALLFLTCWGTVTSTINVVELIAKLAKVIEDESETFVLKQSLPFQFTQIVPFAMFWDMRNFLKYLDDWMAFQENYESKIKSPFKIDFRLSQICLLTLNMVLMAGFVVRFLLYDHQLFENYDLRAFYIWDYILSFYRAILFVLPAISWIYSCLSVKKVSEELLEALKSAEGNCRALKQHRLLWRQLRELFCEIGPAHQFSSIFFTIFTFVNILLQWFSTFDMNSGFPWYAMLPLSLATSTFVAFLPEFAHRTSEKLASAFHLELARQIKIASSNDVEMELKIFDQEIYLHPPIISLGGFCDMNRHFTCSALSSFMTYMLVLIQFRAAFFSPK